MLQSLVRPPRWPALHANDTRLGRGQRACAQLHHSRQQAFLEVAAADNALALVHRVVHEQVELLAGVQLLVHVEAQLQQ